VQFEAQSATLRRMVSDKIEASYPGLPIVWPNEDFDPPAPPATPDAAKPWLGSYLRYATRFDIDAVRHFEHSTNHRLTGILTIGVFVPKGFGLGYLEQISWDVARIIREVRLDGFVFFRGPLLGPALLDDGEAHAFMNVSASFVADASF
jgi:hypothetical protein